MGFFAPKIKRLLRK